MTCIKSFILGFIFIFGISNKLVSQSSPKVQIGRVKYGGGGDWYSSKTALKNLTKFCNFRIKTNLKEDEVIVEVGSEQLFNFPFLFLTGHGNIIFNEGDSKNLRNYLIAGGFLHICDNYGMDIFIRREMKKVFPELEFKPVPFNHPVYHQQFQFNNGLPKVHEHDGKPPLGLGLFWEGKLVCFYDYECDLGNGWEDPELYNDSPEIREKALQMGANLIQYALTLQ